ncbi:MAG: hypothetical protein AB8B96_13435 [Lysobacterales bacterium]
MKYVCAGPTVFLLRALIVIISSILVAGVAETAQAGALPEVNLELLDGDMAELDRDPGSFRVTRSNNGNTAAAITVNIDIGGTAQRNTDYSLSGVFGGAPLAVSIPGGQLFADFSLLPSVDNAVEGAETIQITLQPNAAMYTVGADTNVDFTLSDDVAEVTLTVLDSDMAELGQDPGSFRVTRSNNGNIAAAITVNIDIAGSALRNTDYSLNGVFGGAPLAVSIPGGQLSADYSLVPRVDNAVEGDELIQITLQPNAAMYTVGSNTMANFILVDDVPVVSLTLLDGAMEELDQDPGSFRVTRSENGNISAAIAVNVDITGSAQRNADYSLSGVFGGAPLAVSIPSGELSADFSLVPRVDNAVEGDETIQIVLQPNAATYTLGTDTTANFTLIDDVPEVTLTLIDGEMSEQGLDPGTFRITRSNNGNVAAPIVVNIDIAGTAQRNSDYTLSGVFGGAPLAVSIPASQLATEFVLTPLADAPDNEDDETVVVTLQPNPTTYLVGADTTANFVLFDLLDFLFSNSFEAVSNKACQLTKATWENPERFFDQGDTVLDLQTELVWSKCGLDQTFDWTLSQCVPGVPLTAPSDEFLAEFNAGLLGDNGGFSDWRWASVKERASLPTQCAEILMR